MAAGNAQSLEGRLASRALQTVVPGAVVLAGLEAIPAPERAANLTHLLSEAVKNAVNSHTPALVVSWRVEHAPARAAQMQLETWLGGVPVPSGIGDTEAAALDKVLVDGFMHRMVVEHGSLLSWQLVHLYDVLTTLAAEPMPELAAAGQALTAAATVLGRHGPATYRTTILSATPFKLTGDLTAYRADADEKLLDAAPALIQALQTMYLAGYVQRRDLDTLRGEKARLTQALAELHAQSIKS